MPKAIKKPIISLKNVKFHKGHDGVGLNCDLYVDGKKVSEVHDDAYGGGNEYNPCGKTPAEVKANRKTLEDLEAYAKTQTYVSEFNDKPMTKNLDIIIDEILHEQEKEKEAKKIEKKFATHIITGVPNGESTLEYTYKKRLLSTIPVARLQADIDAIKAKLKVGERILNTNLQALGINI
jgi:hypothetical protein